jgi:pimeloyl-ACP methyl ester carboxylesterase
MGRWADSLYQVAQWNRFPSGGHFAAMEEPAALVEDVRALFRSVRG